MKKIYTTPVSRVYNISHKHVIAASPQLFLSSTPADAGYDGGGDVKADQTITSPDLWDDEW